MIEILRLLRMAFERLVIQNPLIILMSTGEGPKLVESKPLRDYESSSQPKHIIGGTVRQESARRIFARYLFRFFLLAPAVALGQEEKVKVGLLMINADAGVFLALEKGYFREQGLAVELTYFASSGGLQMAALTTGELDVGSGAIGPGIYNAVAGGVNMRVVASKSRVGPRASGKFMVRRSLLNAGKPVAIKDIKGRVVALNSAGGLSRLYLDGLLKKGGLKETDVVVRVMPFNEMVGALSQGAVDVAFLVQPFITIVDEKGIGAGIADLWEIFPGHMTNNLFYSNALIRERPALAEKFMLGFLKGQRYFYDAVVKKKESVDSVIDIVAKYARGGDKKLLRLALNGTELTPNGEMDLKEIQDDQEWYFQKGLIKTKVDVSKMVDLRFVQAALQILGSYR
jgi:NitT/TauT family transport system substrate-binding protein